MNVYNGENDNFGFRSFDLRTVAVPDVTDNNKTGSKTAALLTKNDDNIAQNFLTISESNTGTYLTYNIGIKKVKAFLNI